VKDAENPFAHPHYWSSFVLIGNWRLLEKLFNKERENKTMSKFIINGGVKTAQTIFSNIFLFALLALTVFGQTKPEADMRPLTTGQSIECELKGDEAHSYSLALTAGQYLNVVVEQKGVDVVVTLFDADGKKVIKVDSPNGTQGAEPLSAISETTGNYCLEVRSLEKSAPAGHYEAKITELRTATEKDKNQIAAPRNNSPRSPTIKISCRQLPICNQCKPLCAKLPPPQNRTPSPFTRSLAKRIFTRLSLCPTVTNRKKFPCQ